MRVCSSFIDLSDSELKLTVELEENKMAEE